MNLTLQYQSKTTLTFSTECSFGGAEIAYLTVVRRFQQLVVTRLQHLAYPS